MTSPSLLEEPGRVDEPHLAQEYADVLSQVASAGRPVIVRRNGEDFAAVIPVEQLQIVREISRNRKSRNPRRRLTGGGQVQSFDLHNRGSTTKRTIRSSRPSESAP